MVKRKGPHVPVGGPGQGKCVLAELMSDVTEDQTPIETISESTGLIARASWRAQERRRERGLIFSNETCTPSVRSAHPEWCLHLTTDATYPY